MSPSVAQSQVSSGKRFTWPVVLKPGVFEEHITGAQAWPCAALARRKGVLKVTSILPSGDVAQP